MVSAFVRGDQRHFRARNRSRSRERMNRQRPEGRFHDRRQLHDEFGQNYGFREGRQQFSPTRSRPSPYRNQGGNTAYYSDHRDPQHYSAYHKQSGNDQRFAQPLQNEQHQYTAASNPRKIQKQIALPQGDFNYAGLIIGPRGQQQRQLEQLTNCRIEVHGLPYKRLSPGGEHYSQSNKDQEFVLVEGDDERSVDYAIKEIERIIFDDPHERDRLKREQLTEMARSKTDSHQKASYIPPSTHKRELEPITETISIPSECAGAIIGRSGETIRALQHESGVKIQVATKSQPEPPYRNVFMKGEPSAIDLVKSKIQRLLDEWAIAHTQTPKAIQSSMTDQNNQSMGNPSEKQTLQQNPYFAYNQNTFPVSGDSLHLQQDQSADHEFQRQNSQQKLQFPPQPLRSKETSQSLYNQSNNSQFQQAQGPMTHGQSQPTTLPYEFPGQWTGVGNIVSQPNPYQSMSLQNPYQSHQMVSNLPMPATNNQTNLLDAGKAAQHQMLQVNQILYSQTPQTIGGQQGRPQGGGYPGRTQGSMDGPIGQANSMMKQMNAQNLGSQAQDQSLNLANASRMDN